MISVVQHTSAVLQYTEGTSGILSPVFTGPTTAGNTLFACINLYEAPTDELALTSVTTNGTAENWISAANLGGGATDGSQTAIWVNGSTGGSQTVIDINFTFGFTATTSISVCALADIYEVSGIQYPVVDRISSGNISSGTSWSSGSTSATARATEIWFGVAGITPTADNTTSTVTGPASPWVNSTVLQTSVQAGGTSSSDTLYNYQISGYQIVSSTGTATYSGTCSDTSGAGILAATFFPTTPSILTGAVPNVTVAAVSGETPLSSLGPQPGNAVAPYAQPRKPAVIPSPGPAVSSMRQR